MHIPVLNPARQDSLIAAGLVLEQLGPEAPVTLVAPDPGPRRLRGPADLLGQLADHRPLRVVLGPELRHQTHHALFNLG